ncbi:hypothetical protein QAD02_011574 [Eretmocerus hayati]|uniref:Uncharacterized protein n=1 Tax=Eretmocerus hayati TaxID=131215 RepID=A0ACC2NX46_9HYME|nr:hypothetical protein QAD02_011574 [Eretmocerus hayati]
MGTIENGSKNDPRNLMPLLQQTFKNGLRILDCKTEELVPLGENFASSLLKIVAKIQKSKDGPIEELYLVGKLVQLDNPYFNWTKVLKRETFMYTDIIPFYKSIEVVQDVECWKTIDNFIPKLYGYRLSLDPKIDEADKDAMILLENLQARGYYVLDKNKGLDLKHAIAAIQALARFHALGIIARHKNPTGFEKIKAVAMEFALNDTLDWDFLNGMIRVVEEHPNFNRYAERFRDLVEIFKKKDKYDLVRHTSWSTIIHNDYWTNNIMFHTNEKDDIDGLNFIDFQFYNYANLFVDLPYFLFSSLQEDVLLKDFDHLLDVYYESFVGTLKSNHLDVKQYSRDLFDNQLKKDALFELVHCSFALSFFTTEVDDDTKNRDELMQKILAFKGNDNYYRKLKMLFESYERKEWL